ncbi:hypothetical protein SALBM135S_01072 [Streptomyces alboniger]
MNKIKRLLAVLALAGAALAVTGAAHGASAGPHGERNPFPPLPVTEPLISEGVTIEGPLINNLVLPQRL